MMEQQLNLLKYIIDYPAEENIALVPVNTEMITPAALTGLSETLYELQLLQSQKQLAEQQKTIIPKTVTCGGKFNDFKNSAPDTAISAPHVRCTQTHIGIEQQKNKIRSAALKFS